MTHPTRPRPRPAAPAPFAGPLVLFLGLVLAVATGCQRSPSPGRDAGAPTSPEATVEALAARMRAGDLGGYARIAVPPALHAELETAWREDRSRWPLSELPLAGRLQPLLAALAAEGSEARMKAAFQQQFAGAERELDAAAESLALFGVEYVGNEGDFSDAERVHYAQVIEALGPWAVEAPLADPDRAEAAIRRLASAARATGLDEPADFASLGMDGSLARLQPFLAAAKRTLAEYGLDLDASLDGLSAEPVSQDGDRAVVAVRYPLAGRTIETELALQRIDGRWYPVDSMRNARASLAGAAAAPAAAPADGAEPAGAALR